MKTREELIGAYAMPGGSVIITGAGRGIGEATAHLFAAAGANVAICDLHADRVEKVAAEIKEQWGVKTVGMACDVTDEAACERFVNASVKEFGGLTSLINNVGWGEPVPILGCSTEYMVDAFKLNTVSAYTMSRLCAPHLEKSNNGSITMAGSMVGETPAPEFIAYSTAKAALKHMTRGMANGLGPALRVNMVTIGSINTEGTYEVGYDQAMTDRLAAKMVMGRRGDVYDCAHAFLYLASEAGKWVTGVDLRVDGGGSKISMMPKAD
jgi:7-alpha-hydroxysteroid dehydrogenase